MSKILGIDYGQKKVGLALADNETKIAIPFAVVSPEKLKSKIQELIDSEEINKIVVGWPLALSGQETNQTKEVGEFVKELRSIFDIEVVTEDERLTTTQANKQGKPASTSRRRGEDDAVAAMHILQTHLDRHYG